MTTAKIMKKSQKNIFSKAFAQLYSDIFSSDRPIIASRDEIKLNLFILSFLEFFL